MIKENSVKKELERLFDFFVNLAVISCLIGLAAAYALSVTNENYGMRPSLSNHANPMGLATLPYRPMDFVTSPYRPEGAEVFRAEIIEDLAYTMWCEASGEGRVGMIAVGDVVRNRVMSDLFPDDWYEVIHTPKQFSCWGEDGFTQVRPPERHSKSYREALVLAEKVYEGRAPKMTANALFYHAKHVNPYWVISYRKLGAIGNHIFYTTDNL